MKYVGPEKESNLLVNFLFGADRILIEELKTGSKKVEHIQARLNGYYGELLRNPEFSEAIKIYSDWISSDYTTPDNFVKNFLKSAENGKWVRRTGENYELGENGTEDSRIYQTWIRLAKLGELNSYEMVESLARSLDDYSKAWNERVTQIMKDEGISREEADHKIAIKNFRRIKASTPADDWKFIVERINDSDPLLGKGLKELS